MRFLALAGSLGVPLVLWLAPLAGQSPPGAAAPVTFNRDVAPILYARCTSCHRPGQMAPMSLLTYEAARPWARSIRRAVGERRMPPWFADPHVGRFSNDSSLSDREIDVLTRWVDGGAPQGEPADLPPAPQYNDGWRIGTPDLVVSMAQPFGLPASGIVEYQYFEIPTRLTEDRWLQAVEIRPSNRRAVHHALLFALGPNDVPPRDVGGTKCAGAVCGEIDTVDLKFGSMITVAALGSTPDVYPAGTAKLVKAGSVLTLQVHYTTVGEATSDQTSIGLIFAKEPPKTELQTVALSKEGFVIPPRAPKHTIAATMEFQSDATVWSIAPHSHLRGVTWRVDVVSPGGRPRPLLSVPKYDFNWQLNYMLDPLLDVRKGTRILAEAVYDNSAANRHNPDPNVEVRYGGQTTDEMMFAWIVYSTRKQS